METDYNNYYEYDNPTEENLMKGQINEFKSSENSDIIHQNMIANRASQPSSPMSPIQASATVINLLLATGPFTYPQGFV